MIALLLTTLFALQPAQETGYASAYAPGVMDATVTYRVENNVWRVQPPYDWYTVHGYVAAMNCARVGQIATLIDPAGRRYRVLVADCAGADGPPDRFHRLGVIAELDWRLWERLTAEFGKPLPITLEWR